MAITVRDHEYKSDTVYHGIEKIQFADGIVKKQNAENEMLNGENRVLRNLSKSKTLR